MTSPVVGPVHCISCNITFSSQATLDQHLPCSNSEFDLSKVKTEIEGSPAELSNIAKGNTCNGLLSTANIKKEIKEEVGDDSLLGDTSNCTSTNKSASFSSANNAKVMSKISLRGIGRGRGRGRGGRGRGSISKRGKTRMDTQVPYTQQILPKPPSVVFNQGQGAPLKIENVFFTDPKHLKEKISNTSRTFTSNPTSSVVSAQLPGNLFPNISNSFQVTGSPVSSAFPAINSQNVLNPLQLNPLVLGNTVIQNAQQASFGLGIGPCGQMINPIQNVSAIQPNTLLQGLQNLSMTQSIPIQNISPALNFMAQSNVTSLSNVNQTIQGSSTSTLNSTSSKVPVLVGNQIVLMDIPSVTPQSGISSSVNTLPTPKFTVSQSLPSPVVTATQLSAPLTSTLPSVATSFCGVSQSPAIASTFQSSDKQTPISCSINKELVQSLGASVSTCTDNSVIKTLLSHKKSPVSSVSSSTLTSPPPLKLGVCETVESKDLKSSVKPPSLKQGTVTKQCENTSSKSKEKSTSLNSSDLSTTTCLSQTNEKCNFNKKEEKCLNSELQISSKGISEAREKTIIVPTRVQVPGSNSEISVISPPPMVSSCKTIFSNSNVLQSSFAAMLPQSTSVLSSPQQGNISVLPGPINFTNNIINTGSNPGLAFSQQPNIVLGGNSGQNVWIQNITNNQPIVIGNTANQQPLLMGNHVSGQNQTVLFGNQVLNIAGAVQSCPETIQNNVIFPKGQVESFSVKEKTETSLVHTALPVTSGIPTTSDAAPVISKSQSDSVSKVTVESIGAKGETEPKNKNDLFGKDGATHKTKPALSQLSDPATGPREKGSVVGKNNIHSDTNTQTATVIQGQQQQYTSSTGSQTMPGTYAHNPVEPERDNSLTTIKKVSHKKQIPLSLYYDPTTGLFKKDSTADSDSKITSPFDGQQEKDTQNVKSIKDSHDFPAQPDLGVFFNDRNIKGAKCEKNSKSRVFVGPLTKEELDKVIIDPSHLQKYVSIPSGQIVIAPKAIAVPASSFGKSMAPVMTKNITDLQKTFQQPIFINEAAGCSSTDTMTVCNSIPLSSVVTPVLSSSQGFTTTGCSNKQFDQIEQGNSKLSYPPKRKLTKANDDTKTMDVFQSDKTSRGKKRQKFMSEKRRTEVTNEAHKRNDLMKLSFVGDLNFLKDALRRTTVPLKRLRIPSDSFCSIPSSFLTNDYKNGARGSDHSPSVCKRKRHTVGETESRGYKNNRNKEKQICGDVQEKWVPIEVVGDLTIRGKLLGKDSPDSKEYPGNGKRRSNRISSKPKLDYADLERKPFKDLDDESDSDFEIDKKQKYKICNEIDDDRFLQSEAGLDFETPEESLSVYDEDTNDSFNDSTDTEAECGEKRIKSRKTKSDYRCKAGKKKISVYDEDTDVSDTEADHGKQNIEHNSRSSSFQAVQGMSDPISSQGVKSVASLSSSPSVVPQLLIIEDISMDTENSPEAGKLEGENLMDTNRSTALFPDKSQDKKRKVDAESEIKRKDHIENERKRKEDLKMEGKRKEDLESEIKRKEDNESEIKRKEDNESERKRKEDFESERKRKEDLDSERKTKEDLDSERKRKEDLDSERKTKEDLDSERRRKEDSRSKSDIKQFEDYFYSSESESDMFDPDLECVGKPDKKKMMFKRHSEVTMFLVKNSGLFWSQSDKDEYYCQMCNQYKTNGIFSLSKHLKKHLSGSLKCSQCPFEACHEEKLKEHYDNMHRDKV